MKKIVFLLSFLFLFTFNTFTYSLPGTLELGGKIIYIVRTCQVPVAINVITLVPNGPGSGSWMYIPGVSFSYRNGPPSHEGQDLLGLAIPNYVPCLKIVSFGYDTIGPGGSTILYHGSSI